MVSSDIPNMPIMESCNVRGCQYLIEKHLKVGLLSEYGRGRRVMSARLRLNVPRLENYVRQDCDISHSE